MPYRALRPETMLSVASAACSTGSARLAEIALGCKDTRRLMTIPCVDVAVAMAITAAVGEFGRFSSPSTEAELAAPDCRP